MSKILFINSVCNGSTGKICKDIYDIAESNGHECIIAFGRGEYPKGYSTIKIGTKSGFYSHVLKTRLFDYHGFGSKRDTTLFLERVDNFKPDIIHLHNIHGYYINVSILFDYLKKHTEIKVIWTLHDCWSFTGHCAHFTYSKCEQWRTGCKKCDEKLGYPKSILFSNVKKNYKLKKQAFNLGNNLTLVTPSLWLKELVNNSFFHYNKCIVINNGIDLTIFKDLKDIRKVKEIVILGIANIWNERKGFSSFIELAEKLKNKPYKIVMIGLSKQQMANLPENIQGITRTNSIKDLVKLYNQADVLFNPTLEDNYPTVNLEAQACGVPVVSFDSGGTRETLLSHSSYLVKSVEEFIKLLQVVDFRNTEFEIDYTKIDKTECFKTYLKLYGGC